MFSLLVLSGSDPVLILGFQVTDHATTALLHYQLPQMPDVVVRSFMVSGSRGHA